METRRMVVEGLMVLVYRDCRELGAAAGRTVADRLRALLEKQRTVRAVFASAASQREFLGALSAASGVEWWRVVAFHLDEHIGLPVGYPQSFGQFLEDAPLDLACIGLGENGHLAFNDPHVAYTMRIPAILSARSIYCMAPGKSKAEAVRRTLSDPVSTDCPATALRCHREATLFLDEDSAERVDTSIAGRCGHD
jgi:glucosamine-6-phosphate deaminase